MPALSVVTSADGGWDGALLVEADAGPVRSGEVHHRHQAVSIQRWETPNDARSIGGRGGWRISPLHLDDATQLSRMLRRYAGEEPGAYRRR